MKYIRGKRFGLLVALEPTEKRKGSCVVWNCRCDCGNIIEVSTKELSKGTKRSCGCIDASLYCVYVHVFPDGRRYIGKTKRTPANRWSSGSKYEGQYAIEEAISAIGGHRSFIENVEHLILMPDGSLVPWISSMKFDDTNFYGEEEASKLEKELIEKYKTMDTRFGLNATSGGDNDFTYNYGAISREKEAHVGLSAGEKNPFWGKHHTKETKALIGGKAKQRIEESGIVNFKGQKHTPETIAILSEKAKKRIAENGGTFTGKHHTEEAKARLSEQHRKPITRYDKDGSKIDSFTSVNNAAKKMGLSVSAICSCANKHTKECGGFIWRYIDIDKLPDSEMPCKTHKKCKKVRQYDLDGNLLQTFDSLKDAAESTGLSNTAISAAIYKRKGSNVLGGYTWSYESTPVKGTGNQKVVLQFTKDKVLIKEYPSVLEAAKETGVNKKNISAAACGSHLSAGGYIWKYKE